MWQNLFKPQYRQWQWALCVATSSYVLLFLVLCEPFKCAQIPYVWDSTEDFIKHSVIDFFMVIISCTIPLIVLPKFLPKFFAAEHLTLQRLGILIIILTLTLEISNLLTNYVYFHSELSLVWFVIFLFKVTIPILIFAVFPFFYCFYLIFNYYTNTDETNKKRSTNIDFPNPETPTEVDNHQQLSAVSPPQYSNGFAPNLLRFSDNSNKKCLEVPVANFFYVTSAQNYIEVFYKDKNSVHTRQLLRNSLKAIEEEMISNNVQSHLIRCHKAFIVNREKVIELRGPAKAAQFILEDLDTTIPVSRQKYAEFEPLFSTPNNNFI